MTSPGRTKHYMLIIKCQEEPGGRGSKSISEPIEIPGTVAALFLQAPPPEGAKTGQANRSQQKEADLSECLMTIKGCDEGRSPLITRLQREELHVPGIQTLEPVLPTIKEVHQFVASIFELDIEPRNYREQTHRSYFPKRPSSEQELQNRVCKWANNAHFCGPRKHPLDIGNFEEDNLNNVDSGNCSSCSATSYTTGTGFSSAYDQDEGLSCYSGATLSPRAYYNESNFSASSETVTRPPAHVDRVESARAKRPRSAPSSTTDISSFSKRPRFHPRNETCNNFANYRTTNRSCGGSSL